MFGTSLGWQNATGPASSMIAVNGYTAMRNILSPQHNALYYLRYGDAEGDNNGGAYRFDAFSPLADDPPRVIRPTNISQSIPGRFLRHS